MLYSPSELVNLLKGNDIKIAWWSAGITSAVACKLALELYPNTVLIYIETGKAHPDNKRFKEECENWYGAEIFNVNNSGGYKNPIDVMLKTGYVNGVNGARCTLELKKKVRYEIEKLMNPDLFVQQNGKILNQIFGFEWSQKEVNRAIRFKQQYPNSNPLFPLIERGINKNNAAAILQKNKITLPWMYVHGYNNNNCIGCVKGGKGYWNKIKSDFPETFNEMAIAEKKVGYSCIKNKFLFDLKESEGRDLKEIIPECGNFCEIELEDILVKDIEKVMNREISVYEAA